MATPGRGSGEGALTIGHVAVTAVVAEGRFWQCPGMWHVFRRLWLGALLTMALALGQVPAMGYAVGKPMHTAAATHMDGMASARCHACDRMADLDDGAVCSLPCSKAGPALPVVASALTTWIVLRFVPMPWSHLPDGRTVPPEPYPPKAFA